jgi:putative membrane protein
MKDESQSSKAIAPVIGISAVILGFLFWLIYFQTPAESDASWLSKVPTLIASFNALSACCLTIGLVAIKRGHRKTHIAMMISATTSSALFLVCYIIRHHYAGDTQFMGQGIIRPVYFFILISHILLSAVVVPLILLTLWFAIKEYYTKHKRIARWTFPIWMYVSVTGILVYLILNNFNHA